MAHPYGKAYTDLCHTLDHDTDTLLDLLGTTHVRVDDVRDDMIDEASTQVLISALACAQYRVDHMPQMNAITGTVQYTVTKNDRGYTIEKGVTA